MDFKESDDSDFSQEATSPLNGIFYEIYFQF